MFLAFANSLLIIYVWSIVITHLIIIMAIARFYERKSARRAYYRWFVIPAVVLMIAAFRYAFLPDQLVGDMWGDTLRLIGGVMSIGLTIFLLKLMMGKRP